MKRLRITTSIALALFVSMCVLPLTSQAQLMLDFTGDTFFDNNPVALAALEAAAADINAAVDFSCLAAITDDVNTGVSGDGVSGLLFVDFDFRREYTNPADGVQTTIQDSTIPAGQINIFAGGRTFGGNTLGQGGPAGTGVSVRGFGVGDGGGGTVAQSVADAMANEQHSRTSGPVIGTTSGDFLGTTFSFDHGIHTANIAFDDDAIWHFDHTTPVAAGTSDFYSVALHELLHAIGVGTSETWNSLVSGTNYFGTEGIAANGGSGIGLIHTDGEHLALNTTSTRISDGGTQVALLDPTLVQGTRRTLTELDLAVLRDIGYKTIPPLAVAVPEPSSLALLVLGVAAMGVRRRKMAP